MCQHCNKKKKHTPIEKWMTTRTGFKTWAKKGRKCFVIKPKQHNPTGMFYIVNDRMDETLLIIECASKKKRANKEWGRDKSALAVNGIIFTVQAMDYLPKQSKNKHKKKKNVTRNTMKSIVQRKQALEKYSRSVCCYKHTHKNKQTHSLKIVPQRIEFVN